MNYFEVVIHAGQLKYYIKKMEQLCDVNIKVHLASRDKIKVVYHVSTVLEMDAIKQIISRELNELKGLYYLLQLKKL